MAIIDCFTYNGELPILKLHLSVLGPYVDRFIIVEANKTFSGQDKPLYFFKQQRYFEPWWNKIDYYVMNHWDDVAMWEQAILSPQTQGPHHWKREFYIKESIHKALEQFKVQPQDTVFIGDVDEIINPQAKYESKTPIKAKLEVYTYYLNNKSTEQFWGTLIAKYADIQDNCLNHMRADKTLYSQGEPLGWHFTSQGGVEEVRRKLNDSYTTESYNKQHVQLNLPETIKQNLDFLGRPFTYTKDESTWPQFLKENKQSFKQLCK